MRSFNCRRDGKDIACPKEGSMAPGKCSRRHDVSGMRGWRSCIISLLQTPTTIVFFPLLPQSVAAAALHFHRREALLLHGCDEGWNKLDREVDKKIVDGQRLVSMLHSSHKRHDDSLHKGECTHILFARLFLLGQGCLCSLAIWRLC